MFARILDVVDRRVPSKIENNMRKSLVGIFLLQVLLSFGQETVRKPDIPGDITVDIGFNSWDATPDSIGQDIWPSKSISVYYTKNKLLNRNFAINYGLGLGLEKIDLGNGNTLYSENDDVLIENFPFDDDDLIKNKLALTYVDVPVDFRFYPNGTESGNGFFVGVGGMLGLRVSAHTKWKYEEDNETVVQKVSGNFDLSAIRYGYQVRVGFKGTNLFFKHYPSNTFQDDINDVNPNLTTIGISFSGF